MRHNAHSCLCTSRIGPLGRTSCMEFICYRREIINYIITGYEEHIYPIWLIAQYYSYCDYYFRLLHTVRTCDCFAMAMQDLLAAQHDSEKVSISLFL